MNIFIRMYNWFSTAPKTLSDKYLNLLKKGYSHKEIKQMSKPVHSEETFEQKMDRYFIPKLEDIRSKELHHLHFLRRHKDTGLDIRVFIKESKAQIKYLDKRIKQYKEYVNRKNNVPQTKI